MRNPNKSSLYDVMQNRRQAEAGRAVFLSTSVVYGVRPFWGLYAATKAALEVMGRSYADELGVSRAKANMFDPGRLRTQMRAKSHPGEDPETLPHPSVAAPALIADLDTEFDIGNYAGNGQRFDFLSKQTTPL